VTLNGRPLAAGRYGVHMIPGAETWTVIFSTNSTSWGSFSYQRYARTVTFQQMVRPGVEMAVQGDRVLSTGDFVAAQTFTVVVGRWRPWLSVGGGVSIDHFTSPEPRYAPGESRTTLPLVQGAAGFHLEVAPQTDGGIQFDYAHLFEPVFVTSAGERLHVFGDRLAVRFEMQYRF